MALFLTNEEVERLVTVEDAIEVLESTFADLGAGRLSSRPCTLNYTGLGEGEFFLYSCMGPSSGSGVQYILAWVAYNRAREQGIGFEIPDELFLQDVSP